jgi:hypothetical protein
MYNYHCHWEFTRKNLCFLRLLEFFEHGWFLAYVKPISRVYHLYKRRIFFFLSSHTFALNVKCTVRWSVQKILKLPEKFCTFIWEAFSSNDRQDTSKPFWAFPVIFFSVSRQNSRIAPQLAHECFSPNLFQRFHHPYHSMLFFFCNPDRPVK